MPLFNSLYDLLSKLLMPEQIVDLYERSIPNEWKDQAREYAQKIIQMCEIMDSDQLDEDSFSIIKSVSEELIQLLDNDFFATQIDKLRTINLYASSVEDMIKASHLIGNRTISNITKTIQQEQLVRKPLNKLFFGLFYPEHQEQGDFTVS